MTAFGYGLRGCPRARRCNGGLGGGCDRLNGRVRRLLGPRRGCGLGGGLDGGRLRGRPRRRFDSLA